MNGIMSKIHLELLDNKRLAVFNKLSAFRDKGYLAGGTALALQINHRISEDFDVFVNHEIDNKLRLKVKQTFEEVVYYINSADQISFATESGVRVTFQISYFNWIATACIN